MDTGILITALVGNIPALLILYWVSQERKERMEEHEQHYRLLLAIAGYETDPDDKKVIRLRGDREPLATLKTS